jgi:hypothetical protein
MKVEPFFNKESELALDLKFERIRNWSDKEKGTCCARLR